MAVVLAVDVGCVLAFDQRVLVDGVRVNTDRKAYGVGQTIKVSMFLVNKLDHFRHIYWLSRSFFRRLSFPR